MQLLPFDASEYLTSPESQIELQQDAFNTADAGYIAAALGVIVRARGMTDVARTAGVTREALHKTLSADGDPRLSTLLGVMKAVGLELKVRVSCNQVLYAFRALAPTSPGVSKVWPNTRRMI